MLTTVKRVVVITAVATAGLFASGGAVHAATRPAAAARASVSFAVEAMPATLPSVTVSGTPPTFNPTSNTVAPSAAGGCSGTNAVFTITNDESKGISLKASIDGGKFSKFAKIKKDSTVYVCEYGSAGDYFTYSIKKSTSTLTSTLS
jgi:hypothetical protein